MNGNIHKMSLSQCVLKEFRIGPLATGKYFLQNEKLESNGRCLYSTFNWAMGLLNFELSRLSMFLGYADHFDTAVATYERASNGSIR